MGGRGETEMGKHETHVERRRDRREELGINRREEEKGR